MRLDEKFVVRVTLPRHLISHGGVRVWAASLQPGVGLFVLGLYIFGFVSCD